MYRIILFTIGIHLICCFDLIAQEKFSDSREIYFSIGPVSSGELESIGRVVSIDHFDGERATAYATPAGFNEFLRLGYGFRLLPHPGKSTEPLMRSTVNISDRPDWDFYPTYDAYLDIMQQFQNNHPDLCQVFSIGQSLEGREIMMARISDNPGEDEGEPQFLYTSTMHGNELTGYVLMLHLIDHLLTSYGNDQRITNMIDRLDIWINPLANPDGTYAGGNGTVYGSTRFNANGVDLNRNFPDPEDGPHPDGHSWQPETIVFMDLAEERRFTLSCNIHTGAEVCNYPWDTWLQLHADDNWWYYVCREYADTVHQYAPSWYLDDLNNGVTNGYAWYSISGGRQDYMNYFHQCREFTLEISSDFIPPASALPDYWEYNYRSLLNYMEQTLFGIHGTVTDSISGQPVKAMVAIPGHDADSSHVYSNPGSGHYARPVYAGAWDLQFIAPNYAPKTVSAITVANRETVEINIQLVPDSNGLGEKPTDQLFSAWYVRSPSNRLLVRYNGGEPVNVKISIVNISGAGVMSAEADFSDTRPQISLEMGTLSCGVYIVALQTDEVRHSQKFTLY
mgnify:CR=1 FL=1